MPENSPEPPREQLLAAAEVVPRVAEEASPRPRERPRKRRPPANRAAPQYHRRAGPRLRANTLRPVLRKLCRGVQKSEEKANPPQFRQERQISRGPQQSRSPSRPNVERRPPGNNRFGNNNLHAQVNQPRGQPGNNRIRNNNLHAQVNQPQRPENSIFGNGSALASDRPHATPNQLPTHFSGLEPEALDEIQAIIAANYNNAISNDNPEAAYQTPAST